MATNLISVLRFADGEIHVAGVISVVSRTEREHGKDAARAVLDALRDECDMAERIARL